MRSAYLALSAMLTLTACGDKPEVASPTEPQVSAPAALPESHVVAQAPVATAGEAPSGNAPAVDPGKLKYVAVCQGCHGRDGAGQGPFPKLAGRPAAELAAKLKDYRAGKQIGPQSSTMMPFAKPLTDEEIDVITAHLATL